MAVSRAASRVSCIENANELATLDWRSIASRREPQALLMCDPEYFEVKDAKNAFMDGQIDAVDKVLARKQWEELRRIFQLGGTPVHVVSPEPGLEDMVFAANQVLVGETQEGVKYVVLGRMRHESRRNEVVHYRKWFEKSGYEILELPASSSFIFEGHGDAIWHPSKQILWGGWGHRTDEGAYSLLSELTGVAVLKLRLVDSRFYHLDTCFCVVNESTVLAYMPAFDDNGKALIKTVFSDVIEVSAGDANNFACNALVLGNKVYIERGNTATNKALVERGFEVVELDTSEFKKSGGSVFCLKTQVYA